MSGRSLIKQVLKRTPLYSVYRGCMEKKYRKGLVAQLGRWTEDDVHRRVFYTQFIELGDLVFDVGANVGNRSKVFLRMNARTVAFEPQPFCSQILQAGLGPRELFKLETCALGEKVGLAKMFVSDAHTISSMCGRAVGFQSTIGMDRPTCRQKPSIA